MATSSGNSHVADSTTARVMGSQVRKAGRLGQLILGHANISNRSAVRPRENKVGLLLFNDASDHQLVDLCPEWSSSATVYAAAATQLDRA